MVVVLVVRLSEEALARGLFAGEALIVASGERTVVRSTDDLMKVAKSAVLEDRPCRTPSS